MRKIICKIFLCALAILLKCAIIIFVVLLRSKIKKAVLELSRFKAFIFAAFAMIVGKHKEKRQRRKGGKEYAKNYWNE
ncbi:MAG: hypothetical protein IJV12_06190 [Acidaminococcaceae bacterium]|nr:hypothetical protein [Acidaminococcaceae bacterium]